MITTLRTLATRTLLSAIELTRIGNLFPLARGRGVVFTLHHVRPKTHHSFDPNAHLEITPEFLNEAIETVIAAGLTPARLEDLPALLMNADPSTRYVCFTLDDGYRNNAKFAAPIFRKHNVPYTIFICPGFVNRSRTMWWETIVAVLRETNTITFDFGTGPQTLDISSTKSKQTTFKRIANMVENIDEDQVVEKIDTLARTIGLNPISIVDREIMNANDLAELSLDTLCTLGGHTLTHCNLARTSPERLLDEIERSCSMVSKYANHPVKTFAYPYGWARAAGPREFKMVDELGISVAVTTVPGVLQTKSTATMTDVKRVSLNGHFQNNRYVRALITGLPFKLT